MNTQWVEARSIPVTETGCWLWLGCVDGCGYGMATIARKGFRAHRASWANVNGPIPIGGQILHRCDTPSCVNPMHLFLGNNASNVADKMAKGREAKGVALSEKIRGERNGHAKLSAQNVLEIRDAKESGVRLALKYGVSQTTISEIKSHRVWRHI